MHQILYPGTGYAVKRGLVGLRDCQQTAQRTVKEFHVLGYAHLYLGGQLPIIARQLHGSDFLSLPLLHVARLNSYVQRQDLTLHYHFFEILRTAGTHQPDRCVGTAIYWELQIVSQRNSCVWCSDMHM